MYLTKTNTKLNRAKPVQLDRTKKNTRLDRTKNIKLDRTKKNTKLDRTKKGKLDRTKIILTKLDRSKYRIRPH